MKPIKSSRTMNSFGNFVNNAEANGGLIGSMLSSKLQTTGMFKQYQRIEDINKKIALKEEEKREAKQHKRNLEVAEATSTPVVKRIDSFEKNFASSIGSLFNKGSKDKFHQLQRQDESDDLIQQSIQSGKENSNDIVNQLTKLYLLTKDQNKLLENVDNGNGDSPLDILDGDKNGKNKRNKPKSKIGKLMDGASKITDSKLFRFGGAGLAAGFAGYNKYNEVKDDTSLSTGQKTAQVVGSTGGSAAGTIIGGIAGSALGPLGTAAGMAIGGYIGEEVGGVVGELASDVMGTPEYKEMSAGISKSFNGMTTSISNSAASTGKALNETFVEKPKEAWKQVNAYGEKTGKAVSKSLDKAWTSFEETGEDSLKKVQETSNSLFGSMAKGMGSAFSSIGKFVANVGSTAKQAYQSTAEVTKEAWEGAKSIAGKGIGAVAGYFESGKAGAGTVSTGNGDFGGASYGTHQFASANGSLQGYLKNSKYGKEFQGLRAGSAEFNAKWKEVASRDKEGFAKDQEHYVTAKHYMPQQQKLAKSGLDLSKRSDALKSSVFSVGVQFGGGSSLVEKAMAASKLDPKTASDKDIINAIYKYKQDNNSSLFKSSSANVQAGTYKRAQKEQAMVLKLLEEEEAKKGKTSTPMVAENSVTPSKSVSKAEKSTKLSKEEINKLTAERKSLMASGKNPTRLKEIDSLLASANAHPEVNHLKNQGINDPAIIATATGVDVTKVNQQKITPSTDNIPKTDIKKSSKGKGEANQQVLVKQSNGSMPPPTITPSFNISNKLVYTMAIL